MHNIVTRFQGVFGFFTTVLFTVAALVAISDIFAVRAPSASIVPKQTNVIRGRAHYHSTKKTDLASIRFTLDADLSSLFTWNTKQVFVYVTAEWDAPATKNTPAGHNTAVIWDQIITAPSSDFLSNFGPATMKKLKRSAAGKTIDPSRGKFRLDNQRPKYQITHPSGSLAEIPNLRLKVHYNVQPWVGFLTWDMSESLLNWKKMNKGVSKSFDLPAIKAKTPPAGSSSKP
ncbi:hypothetical protein TD95_002178 [Thielaviopsis punctulata]|uniref:Signal peptidase subunit 3 n=1 Tax=Thielaviopsis punctulata TaxID=72032 RepID=A0A0F4ZEV0_9PEZI|nr:hypothetical protein TD95_002178 [Thielaviopsis punctulata]